MLFIKREKEYFPLVVLSAEAFLTPLLYTSYFVMLVSFVESLAIPALMLVAFLGRYHEKLIKIEIYTTDIQPGQCFAVEYPRNAYYLVKAGEEGKFGRTETRKLENSVSTDDVSKAELNEIIAAVRKVDENSNDNYKEDVAYFVSVQYEQKKGYCTVGAYGYGGYPEGWDELVALTNGLCGGDYLSETPTVQDMNFLSGYRNHYPFDAKKHYGSFMDYYQ